jgi:hypothetical protein
MIALNRLEEISENLRDGWPLVGAMTALDGWEARNIGAARMREHLRAATVEMADLAAQIHDALTDLHREHEEMAQELERRPVRLSMWARIFGGPSL